MMKRTTIVTGIATALVFSFSMFVQAAPEGDAAKGDKKKPDGKRPAPEEMFKKLDADGNGKVTLEELKAGPMGQKAPDRVPQMFEKLDANSDGSVTLEEFVEARKKMADRVKGGKGKGDKGGKGDKDGKGKGDKKDADAGTE